MAVIDKKSYREAGSMGNGGGSSSSFPYTQTMMLCVCVLAVFALSQMEITNSSLSSTATTSNRGNYYFINETPRIKQISVLGERNSGTRWTWGHLNACFNHSIDVKTKLTRYKHWFQYPDFARYPHDTLVIAQFRNPYDWLKAMQHVPHHAPAHLKYRHDSQWKKFVTKPWTMERIGTDKLGPNNQTEPCQEHFDFKDIISCAKEPVPKSQYNKIHYSEHQPFYEMRNDGSGEPYKNIMEMRSDKIRNFLEVREYEGVADVWVVQYEYLLTKGTADMINQIADWTGIEPKCKTYPPQQRHNRPLEKEMAIYIKDHLDWEAEALIGYGPHS